MKNSIKFLFALFITFSLVTPQVARAEMPAKARAFLTIVGYGTAGGALLGAASTAFGTSSRAIAQGASLGLYAGILFGTYVLVSHHNRRAGQYDDNGSPYQESQDIYSDEYNSENGGGDGKGGGGFFNKFEVLQDKMNLQRFTFDSEKKKGGQIPPIQFNIFQYNF
ncbi:MAG: hypothetical protein AB7I27_01175 [Bacteriovoracaceae bacterium]